MRLTSFTDYGLRSLMYLAVAHERGVPSASVQVMAEALDVSPHHLAKVAQALARHGFVVSRRGRDGGLSLGRDAATIRVGEVVRALEPADLVPCFEDEGACTITRGCGLRAALGTAQQAFLAALDPVTLADCVARPRALVQLVAAR